MNRPPYLMKVRVKNPDIKINLWLPLFLIYPLLAVILLVLLPFILVAAIILWLMGWGKTLFVIPFAIFSCINAMRGLEVQVEEGKEIVLVSVK